MPVFASPVRAPSAPAPRGITRTLCLAFGIATALSGCSGGSGGDDGGGSGPAPGAQEPVALGAALPDTPGVQFAATAIAVSEANRHVPVQVVRTGPGAGRTVVRYLIGGGTATPGGDLSKVQGQLVWEDGQGGARTIDLQVFSDVESELDETVELILEPLEGDPVGADPLVITVQDAACSTTLPVRVEADLLLDEPCYRLASDLEVVGDAQLSVAAGTTLLADAGVGLRVRERATLVALGDALVPVTLAGTNVQPGWWRGVSIESAVLHRLEEVQIRDAIIGVDVSEGATLGGVVGGGIAGGSGAAMRLPLEAVAALDGGTVFDRGAGVVLTGTRLERETSLSLPALSTHYVLDGSLLVSGALEVLAGAELRFPAASRLLVDADGTLQALGSVEAPVVLRGTTFEPGFWAGVQLLGSTGDNRLEHAVITNGGSDATRDANLSLFGEGTRLRAADLVLAGSAGVGLWLDTRLPRVALTRIGFAENALAQVRRGATVGDLGGDEESDADGV